MCEICHPQNHRRGNREDHNHSHLHMHYATAFMFHAVPLETAWNITAASIIHVHYWSNTMGCIPLKEYEFGRLRRLSKMPESPDCDWKVALKALQPFFFFFQLVPLHTTHHFLLFLWNLSATQGLGSSSSAAKRSGKDSLTLSRVHF